MARLKSTVSRGTSLPRVGHHKRPSLHRSARILGPHLGLPGYLRLARNCELSLPSGEFVQRAEVTVEVASAPAEFAEEPPLKLASSEMASEVEQQARILRPVFVLVLFRHVVLGHFVRAHFSLIRIGRIFHTAHNSRLERLSFF